MPNTRAISPTRWPMRPKPRTPRVLPRSSRPTKAYLSHFWLTVTSRWAGMVWRDSSSILQMVSSATALPFRPGALNTLTPFSSAYLVSMWFRPTEQTPMTFRFLAASRMSLSIMGSTRMISTSTSAIMAFSSSFAGGSFLLTVTSMYLPSSSAMALWTTSMMRHFIEHTPFLISSSPAHWGEFSTQTTLWHNFPRRNITFFLRVVTAI